MILSCSKANVFTIEQVNFSFTKFKLKISDERYLNLNLNEPLVLLFKVDGMKVENVGLLVEISSFENSYQESIYLRVNSSYKIRFLKKGREKAWFKTIKENFEDSELFEGLHRLIDFLNPQIEKLNKFKSYSVTSLKDRIYNHLVNIRHVLNHRLKRNCMEIFFSLLDDVLTDQEDRLKAFNVAFTEKLSILRSRLSRQVEKVILDHELQVKLQKKLSEQQKNFILGEKLNILQQEMGRGYEYNSDKWRGAPEYFKEALAKESNRLKALNRHSPEYPQQKKLVDYLSSLPWKTNEVNENLEEIRSVLDSSHYGLQSVKDELVDYVVAYNRNKKDFNQIICLVGAPGIGKTTIVKSVAKALNREFGKISLAGCSDPNFLLGTSRVYVNANPGSLINQMSQFNFRSPVILLDEIDKTTHRLGSGSAIEYSLLEILDLENNPSFKDHFLDVQYPLNNVLFIATANNLREIPEPLIDRLKIIEIEPYGMSTKMAIAKNWLIPNIRSKLKFEGDLEYLDDDFLEELIGDYSCEAGVRQLKQILEKIVISDIRGKLDLEQDSKLQRLREILKERFLGYDTNKEEREFDVSYPGRSLGLYFSSNYTGGVTLIDVFKGELEKKKVPKEFKFSFHLGGNLGLTMKEAFHQALMAVWCFLNANKLGTLKANDILAYDWVGFYGTGGVSKDGPSAGLATAVAILSALLGLPTGEICMTGEINMRGEVTAIGGLQTKLNGALRNKIFKVIVPKANKKDVNLLENPNLRDLEINYVESLKEAVELIWPKRLKSV